MTPAARVGGGIVAGVIASAIVALVAGATQHAPASDDRLVSEDASGHLKRIAIHYVPSMDDRAMPVWNRLFAVLPADVEVEVAVPAQRDFDHFVTQMPHPERFHAVVVGHALTTWSRDRMAALEGPEGGSVLAPPRIPVASGARAGDWDAPFAIARDVYHSRPKISEIVFEGGDFAASQHHVFADANLMGRNLGRGDASRAHLEGVVNRTFAQDVIWLGDAQGEVPEHHIMMYMVPLDDNSALVGDVRSGMALNHGAGAVPADPDVELMAARFDRVAALLSAHGMKVTRIPVVVLPGAGSYVTYTNALFDRQERPTRSSTCPPTRAPALDDAAAHVYQQLGYEVIPVDVSTTKSTRSTARSAAWST